ncbi:alpha/beta hydrolase [Halomonas kalidii]|uniref:Alpha/beta hydrolase n=1 Tax=Halomonas kalidii TaxID=3043293 RepID=A0ABT6VMT9_9GAMM|nr:alpha/beta hydrolase [Halomonas kalidii]MDI5935296.1 alpha/beta hydrolase [Halomonas kalidii]
MNNMFAATRRSTHLIDGLFVNEVMPANLSPPMPTIVFLHGAYQGWWVYEDWQEYYALAGWRTIALSLRNHPGSYTLEDHQFLELQPDDYVSDVLKVAYWLGSPFVLVAHSMGGVVGQKAAERLPELAALVLLGSGPPRGLGTSRPKDLPSGRPSIPDHQQVRRHMFGTIDDADYAEFHSRLVPETPSVMNQTGRGRVSVDPALIRAPVLAVDAEHDRNQFGPTYADFYSGEYIRVPGASHALMLGPWGMEVANAIHCWLNKRIPGFLYDHRPAWYRPRAGSEG